MNSLPQTRKHSNATGAVVLSVLAGSLVTTTHAAGIYRNGIGARAMSLGGADTTLANSPLAAMTANPAALGDLGLPVEAKALAQKLTELYRRTRVQFKSSRSAPPVTPLNNINANIWSAHAPGTTCFLPINDLTLLYINGLLEIFNGTTGAFILDERAGFRPAGIGKFARSRGGHLEDDPAAAHWLLDAGGFQLVATRPGPMRLPGSQPAHG